MGSVGVSKKEAPTDFIPGGTNQNQYKIDVLKRLGKNVELNAWVQIERWKAPIYIDNPGNAANIDTTMAVQLRWFPKLHTQANSETP